MILLLLILPIAVALFAWIVWRPICDPLNAGIATVGLPIQERTLATRTSSKNVGEASLASTWLERQTTRKGSIGIQTRPNIATRRAWPVRNGAFFWSVNSKLVEVYGLLIEPSSP